jgi:hypothetical protein
MAEKIGKIESKPIARMPRNKVSKTQYSGQNTIQHNENIKRNSIVQIYRIQNKMDLKVGYCLLFV